MDLIGSYSNYIRQQQPGRTIIKENVNINCMRTIEPDTGWFEIVEVPTFDINGVMGGNDDYIDNSSARVSQLFNKKWLSR